MEILINKQLPREQLSELRSHTSQDDPILFAVVGDLSDKAQYSQTALAVTAKCFFTYNFSTGCQSEIYQISEVEDLFNKRMYGNGIMRAKIGDNTVDIFRYTFSVAALCDAAAHFVRSVEKGTPVEEAFSGIEATYEKMLSVCPKCGRTLSAPGVRCINCESKRKIISRLAKYMKPEIGILIFSVLISVLTTALALVPPYLTKTLVDDILVSGNDQTSNI